MIMILLSNHIIVINIPAPICVMCTRPMSEYAKLRHNLSYTLLRLLPAEAVETPRTTNKLFRAVTVKVRQYIYDNCELLLGQRYSSTGYFDYGRPKQEFVAWSLTKV